MLLFYEWGPGVGGRKQAHEFRDPDDDYLWAAGIWEADPEPGPCHTMSTSAASPLMAPVHNPMPALLRSGEMQESLPGSGQRDFQPFIGALVVASCESPLLARAGPAIRNRSFSEVGSLVRIAV